MTRWPRWQGLGWGAVLGWVPRNGVRGQCRQACICLHAGRALLCAELPLGDPCALCGWARMETALWWVSALVLASVHSRVSET